MDIRVFLAERKVENEKRIDDKSSFYKTSFEGCWNFIESSMIKNHEVVNPKFVRRLEILEALLFGFLESTNDQANLEFAERTIYSMGKA